MLVRTERPDVEEAAIASNEGKWGSTEPSPRFEIPSKFPLCDTTLSGEIRPMLLRTGYRATTEMPASWAFGSCWGRVLILHGLFH